MYYTRERYQQDRVAVQEEQHARSRKPSAPDTSYFFPKRDDVLVETQHCERVRKSSKDCMEASAVPLAARAKKPPPPVLRSEVRLENIFDRRTYKAAVFCPSEAIVLKRGEPDPE